MADEHLMSVDEFTRLVSKWAMKIRSQARGTLASTKGSGKLAVRLTQYVDKIANGKPAYKVKFDFARYGVYRAYGVGRGYIMMNGAVVRGYRVRSNRDMKNREFGVEAADMLKKGYLTREVNVAKKLYKHDNKIERTPLDWIDGHISQNVEELANLVQGYYGDEALRNMIANFDKIKIKKK